VVWCEHNKQIVFIPLDRKAPAAVGRTIIACGCRSRMMFLGQPQTAFWVEIQYLSGITIYPAGSSLANHITLIAELKP
jgi:hypothetical protein